MLILSLHPEGQYAVRVLRAGASGYLAKESATDKRVGARSARIHEKMRLTNNAESMKYAYPSHLLD